MNESLGEWRRLYCDSSSGATRCERYIRSTRGEIVPLGLLPNGRHAAHIQAHAGEPVAVPSAATREPSPEPAPGVAFAAATPPQVVPDSPGPQGWQEQPAATVSTAWFERLEHPDPAPLPARGADTAAASPAPVASLTSAPTDPAAAAPLRIPRPRFPLEGGSPARRPARRRWWARLLDWMQGRDD